MSRTLIIARLTLFAVLSLSALLTACSSAPTREVPSVSVDSPSYADIDLWLALYSTVEAMEPSAVVAKLVAFGRPSDTAQLYYYALLNQKLDTFGAWTQARDSLQTLTTREDISDEQQQFLALLLRYNQSRINWYLKFTELQRQHADLEEALQAATQQQNVLQQKIDALTELEAVISTRKGE